MLNTAWAVIMLAGLVDQAGALATPLDVTAARRFVTTLSRSHNQLVAVITTADKKTAEDVADSITEMWAQLLGGTPEAAGTAQKLAQAMTNIEKLPGDELKMGQELTHDWFSSFMRITPHLESEDAAAATAAAKYMAAPPSVPPPGTPPKNPPPGSPPKRPAPTAPTTRATRSRRRCAPRRPIW